MKTITIVLLMLISPAIMAQLSKDEAAIKQVIESETMYFMQRDFDKWQSTWMHSPIIYWAVVIPNQYMEHTSWESLSAMVKEEFKSNPQAITEYPEKGDYRFHVGKNSALVTFKEGDDSGTRMMIKDGKDWKIIQMTVVKKAEFKKEGTMGLLKWALGTWNMDASQSTVDMPWADSVAKQTCHFIKTATGFKIKSVFTNNHGDGQWHMWEVKELNVDQNNNFLPVFIKAGGGNWLDAAIGRAAFKDGKLHISYRIVDKPDWEARKEVYTFDNKGSITLEGTFFGEKGEKDNTYKYVFRR
ncbi:hypothetical protein [Carboxylicivirga sp. M1479]|uniref:hypothetical protein n=1 Tax=Carboxylicivirga sp. M1479 TaxID=2594476 RepID=UPI001177BCCB|nr:hypothetical protein [Carboxylicivirga sp. M1479]TRX71340.1 hypothetical protein FNN09_07045 [Carboxylicivirga sp. M1479]